MATLASVLSGMGIWLVVCLVSPCIAGSDTLEGGTDINAGGNAQDYSHATAR
jgi:hypothetical protein